MGESEVSSPVEQGGSGLSSPSSYPPAPYDVHDVLYSDSANDAIVRNASSYPKADHSFGLASLLSEELMASSEREQDRALDNLTWSLEGTRLSLQRLLSTERQRIVDSSSRLAAAAQSNLEKTDSIARLQHLLSSEQERCERLADEKSCLQRRVDALEAKKTSKPGHNSKVTSIIRDEALSPLELGSAGELVSPVYPCSEASTEVMPNREAEKLRSTLRESLKRLDALATQNEQLRREVASADDSMHVEEQVLRVNEMQLVHLKNQTRSLQRENEVLKRKYDADRNDLREQCLATADQLAKQERRALDLQQELDKTRADYEEQLSKERDDFLRDVVLDIKDKYLESEKECNALQRHNQRLKQEVDVLTSTIELRDQTIESLQNTVREYHLAVEAREQTFIDEKQSLIDRLNRAMETIAKLSS